MTRLAIPRFFLFPLLALCLAQFCPSPAHALGARIPLTPAMLTNESNTGDPAKLIDEQNSNTTPSAATISAPLPLNPKTCWGTYSKTATYPLACVLDLGRERDLGSLWLCDMNSSGRFRVQAGAPGHWHDVLADDLRDYNRWKEFRLAERTRYLRFLKEAPGANVAEIALFEKSRPDPAVTTRTLIDEVHCGDPADTHPFAQFPANASRIATILGRPCRVLPNDAGDLKYFAYRLGAGKNLKPGAACVLEVDYPEDAPRTIFIQNRGCEESLGFHTGPTVGDVLKGRYTFSNAESLSLPLSGQFRAWHTLFFLHERFPGLVQPRGEGRRDELPRDGFWVVVAQPRPASDPLSKGAAVSAIRLYEVPASYYDIPLPGLPDGLPRRHLFCREEMGDGAVASADPLKRGLLSPIDWYEFKARRMRHLAMDTFSKDLLEFGANQGWDASPYGGNAWVFGSDPGQWANILRMLKDYHLNVLPYYEYSGGKGGAQSLGVKKPCVTLGGGRTYTHIKWSETSNCDVTDPRFVQDVHKLLDCTIYRFKNEANFIGAWFRQRPSHLPVSFSDRCLALFAAEQSPSPSQSHSTSDVPHSITRDALKKDKALYARYLAWWFDKRHDFFKSIRDDLRQGTGRPDSFFLFTADTTEPGASYPDWKNPLVVADDVKPWTALGVSAIPLAQAVAQQRHFAALTRPPLTWSWYEWQHSAPPSDPERYQGDDGLMLSYSFNRACTVGSPRSLDAFRTRQGLTLVRHYSLNENEMDIATADGKTTSPLGYFVADVELAGPFCMMAEALAVANGDPTQIGYLSSRQYNRGFFEYVRDFNLNFLALPALPSRVLQGASSDPEVVVRAIATPAHGTWLAVVNTGWREKKNITIKLPDTGPARCLDAVTGQPMPLTAGAIQLTLRPCQLRALRLETAPITG